MKQDEVRTRQEKELWGEYFETMINHLPGGLVVIRYEDDGQMIPEFISEGFAAMTDMKWEEAWSLYQQDALSGAHPDDLPGILAGLKENLARGKSRWEVTYRLVKGDGTYIWVKNDLTMVQNEKGERRIYANYHDITKERNEQDQLRKQYNDLILKHYLTPGTDELFAGHCNVTRNQIIEATDYTKSEILEFFGNARQKFFSDMSGLVVDREEQELFRDAFLNEAVMEAYNRGETEIIRDFFIKLPRDKQGRYARFKVKLVESPDTGDITGILTVKDITEKKISDLIMRQLSVSGYDLVLDVDLSKDYYVTFAGVNEGEAAEGCYSQRMERLTNEKTLPKDRARIASMLDPERVTERLKAEGTYSFSYSFSGRHGDIVTKNLTVSAIDLRLGRICLSRTDITDSLREQQRLFRVIAYTFEILAFIDVNTRQLTFYNRKTVLENLPPFMMEDYDKAVSDFSHYFAPEKDRKEVQEQFLLASFLSGLEKNPSGYDFVISYQSEDGLKYKQINVLWGDRNHTTVCLVRADVTEMLEAERKSQNALEKALVQAEEASQAKSDFLSSMSHDIRTPMNAIVGMTSLAIANINDKSRVKDCLEKISFSSQHLLNLINDILDMNQIERSKIVLKNTGIYVPEQVEKLIAMMQPQAEAAGLKFAIRTEGIRHPYCYGDFLRINQVLINIVGNAIKFTPKGGSVEVLIEEISPVKKGDYARYRFTISDTGMGMPEEFLTRIFEPFVRNDNTMSVEGSGLGLSITKGLVDLMGGEISVESKVDQGTVFHMELELEAAELGSENKKDRSEEFSVSGKEKTLLGRCFLVAEDNALNSEILCELLSMFGAESVVRTDGAKAAQEFASARPGTYDAILMDIQMPNMNGYEATRTIRKMDKEDAKTIPIIAMTANAFAEDVRKSQDAGMDAHLSKPIDVKLLWETLSGLGN